MQEFGRVKQNVLEIANPIEVARTLIDAGLSDYQHPLAARVLRDLEQDGQPITIVVDVAVERASAHLAEHAITTGGFFQESYIDKVRTGYPEDFLDEAHSVEPPRKYARKHGLTEHRRELKDAHDREVAKSRESLLATVGADSYGIDEVELETDTIEDRVVTELTDLRSDLGTQVDKVRNLLLGGRMARLSTFLLRRQGVTNISGDRAEQLEAALGELRALLHTARQGTNGIGRSVAEYFYADVEQVTVTELQSRYDGLAQSALHQLRESVTSAYAEIASQASKRSEGLVQSASTDLKDLSNAPDLEVTVKHIGLEEEVNQTEVQLGEFASPFPWLSDATIHLSVISGEQPMLFCEALPPKLQEVSDRLRKQPETARILTALVERVKEIEASSNATAHGRIKAVWGEVFHGLTVRYLTQATPNAKRIYYARTPAGNYPDLLSSSNGRFDADMPLLILLGEVDKANQLRIYKELGISRRIARNRGAGSV